MKKILSIILILTFLCSLLVGCASNTNDETTKVPTESTQTEKPEVNEEENKNNDESKPTEPDETEKEETSKEDKYSEYLSRVNVELLSIASGISFDEMLIDSPYYPSDYNHMVSMITVGISYESKEVKSAMGLLEFHGETATNPKDNSKPAYQSYDTSHVTDDGLYEIATYIVYGKVDPAKVTVRINTKDKNIYKDIQFENGEEKGFAEAIEKFSGQKKFSYLPSGIIGINDRHYKVVLAGRTEADAFDLSLSGNGAGYVLIVEYKISLLALQGGRYRTLKDEDFKLNAPSNDFSYYIEVTDENIFGGNARLHTSITIQSQKYYETLPLDENGNIDKEFCRQVLQEMVETFDDVTVSFQNNGKETTINVKEKE